MNIKEAIQILEQFKSVAGEDAPCDIERLQLVGATHYDYESEGFGYSTRKAVKKVGYSVAVTIQRKDCALAPGDSGLVSSV